MFYLRSITAIRIREECTCLFKSPRGRLTLVIP